jgi:hypothetical protein
MSRGNGREDTAAGRREFELRRETTLTLARAAARLSLGSWKSANAKLHGWRKEAKSEE